MDSSAIALATSVAVIFMAVINGVLVRNIFLAQRASKDATADRARSLEAEVTRLKYQAQQDERRAKEFEEFRHVRLESEKLVALDLEGVQRSAGLDRLRHVQRLGTQAAQAMAAVDPLQELFTDRGTTRSVKWHVLSQSEQDIPAQLERTDIRKGSQG